eukprot:3504220-Pyramimonas_sp.AAC.2
MDTEELTVKTLSSHLLTREFNSPTNSLRTPYVRAEPLPTMAKGGGGGGATHGPLGVPPKHLACGERIKRIWIN